jgi:c-di-GMP-binding flagellar brake protein YcgR
MEKEGLGNPEKKYVNISASGIRFTVNHPVKVKDVMEVKLLLPTYPPVAVFAYGEVKRVRDIGNGKHEVAIEYVNMSESVRNEIIQYTLSHQRETIKKFKESRSEE